MTWVIPFDLWVPITKARTGRIIFLMLMHLWKGVRPILVSRIELVLTCKCRGLEVSTTIQTSLVSKSMLFVRQR